MDEKSTELGYHDAVEIQDIFLEKKGKEEKHFVLKLGLNSIVNE